MTIKSRRRPRTNVAREGSCVDVEIKFPECGSGHVRPCTRLGEYGQGWIDTSCRNLRTQTQIRRDRPPGCQSDARQPLDDPGLTFSGDALRASGKPPRSATILQSESKANEPARNSAVPENQRRARRTATRSPMRFSPWPEDAAGGVTSPRGGLRAPAPAYNCGDRGVRHCIVEYSYPECGVPARDSRAIMPSQSLGPLAIEPCRI
jgi:hypothetical protein